MRDGLAFDRQQRGAGHRRRERLRAAHAAEPGGEDPACRADRRRSAGGPFRRRSRRCPARCPGCRYRSTSRPSSGRTSSAPCDRARGSAPRSPNAARGWSWRSARAARRRGCGTRRPACRTGPAASDRPRGASASRRCGRSLPVARGPADAAIDDELVRPLGDVGIEIVHQHAQRRFGQPAFGAELAFRAGCG